MALRPDAVGIVPIARADRSKVARRRVVQEALITLTDARLTADEMSLLVAIAREHVTVSALAQRLGRSQVDIRQAGARLYARGLVSWRTDARRGETMLAATSAGLAILGPQLVTAAHARA